jgi:hypothetical protein
MSVLCLYECRYIGELALCVLDRSRDSYMAFSFFFPFD